LNLNCCITGVEHYRSGSQIARVLTEQWLSSQMYCPACSSDALTAAPNNTPGLDFTCTRCPERFQLKSRKSSLSNRIVDSAYVKMIEAIRSDQSPKLLLLQYSNTWSVSNLLLIPNFFITESAIERRKPLSQSARRAGWIGCNILLDRIAPDGRIPVVANGIAVQKTIVRAQFQRIRPFRKLDAEARGWTLEVLNIVRRIGRPGFSLGEVYEFESDLQNAHPANKNVKPKIRQQLQVLRDMGYLRFEGNASYRLLG
jgi:type II restriction enzyme